ncbi:Tol-Pal system protein TolB [Sulfuricurvum sp. IAE1]|uniref:Tol-Pal system protein TolB n=1 Tax=Sulfuricurvum sp. IAE1 TaxID=2546102 RepID=UPI00104EB99C|nr:Tol-Pal system protein TolB [Sulfuricurvum sp. IAE1]MDD3770083.1 Tol-Pal system protein TolB [Sulfuricurvum sp.]MDX9966650.1 Tol-Pal system protein TolB [Sulfuricurvum sp.]TDA69190.1 Tol-Pal system protein TolB [Sulfuricurvum sp. IAE1]
MKLLFVLLSAVCFLRAADATIEVVKGVESLPKLAVEDASAFKSDATVRMSKMLIADMQVVSLFDVDESYATASFDSASPAPAHKEAQYLLRYRLHDDANGGMKADVRLIRNAQELFAKSYVLKQSEMMVFLAHSIAYDINAKMGGAPMEWMKRKVLLTRLTSPRRADIVAADYTLSYQKVILSGGMYGFAKWANREQTDLYYTSLSDFKPTIYKMNLSSGKREKLISSDGMAVCSDVSEDGKRLLLTLAPGGQPDIFLYDTQSGNKTRLTDYSGIDVNGQFLGNDGIAFVSNRMGYPNVFAKNFNSTAISQLVYQGKNNSSLSAYKNLLVYKARENPATYGGNSFNLHLLSLNSGSVKRLTASGENDFPRFSPDGEAILFIKQEGSRSSVGVIRPTVNKSFAFPLKIGRIQSIDW